METMLTQAVEQIYQAFQQESSPFASKSDHILLQTDVTSIATKLDTLLAMMLKPTVSASSPPRAKRQNTTVSPARLANANAQISQGSQDGATAMETERGD
jgi:hypothetical protein